MRSQRTARKCCQLLWVHCCVAQGQEASLQQGGHELPLVPSESTPDWQAVCPGGMTCTPDYSPTPIALLKYFQSESITASKIWSGSFISSTVRCCLGKPSVTTFSLLSGLKCSCAIHKWNNHKMLQQFVQKRHSYTRAWTFRTDIPSNMCTNIFFSICFFHTNTVFNWTCSTKNQFIFTLCKLNTSQVRLIWFKSWHWHCFHSYPNMSSSCSPLKRKHIRPGVLLAVIRKLHL